MEESHKEMYKQMYRNMAFVQRVLKKLEVGIDDTLIDAKNLYFDQQMEGTCDMEARFKRMFEENVFEDDA